MTANSNFKKHLEEISALLDRVSDEMVGRVETASELTLQSILSGKKVIAFGNGGSAADASHFAGEFVGRFRRDRRALPAISLSAETVSVTAIGNDFGFEQIFERQIEAFGIQDDIAIGITTSGSSKNVLRALQKAKEQGLAAVALTGELGLKEDIQCDCIISVPSKITYEIQELHKIILHSICDYVEAAMIQ